MINKEAVYFTQTFAAPGTDLYYACLFETAARRAIIISLHTLLYTLTDIIRIPGSGLPGGNDPSVARIKLSWWQEEIAALAQGKPRHPLTQAIQQALTHLSQPAKQLQLACPRLCAQLAQLVDHITALLPGSTPASLEDWLAIYRNTHGLLWQQCALLLGCDDTTTGKHIATTGALYHCIVALQPLQLNSPLQLPPSDYLSKAARWSPLSTEQQTRLFTPLLSALTAELESNYTALTQAPLPVSYVLILNRLATKTAEKIIRKRCQLLQVKTNLLPIHKLLIAWRTHRIA